jgi:glycosyltransferase involved in cell wall biosynthesis
MSGGTVALVWQQHAPYHVDRLDALARRLGPGWHVVGVQVAPASGTYGWAPTPHGAGYTPVTLFAGDADRVHGPRRLAALWRATRRCGHVVLCHYERPSTWALAVALRLAGRRVWLMFDSTFADARRHGWRERLKQPALAPYHGALVSADASRRYLRSLGMRRRPIATGYDTLAVDRVRREASAPPGPDGIPHSERVFLVVARCVPKKNLGTALDAYARYAERAHAAGRAPRPLWLCGDGPERARLERRVEALGLTRVRFLGFRQPAEVARLLGQSLALLLPSRSEPWGLVVNEALAMGVPALVSHAAGCAHELVRDGVNGAVLAPDAPACWAAAMARLADDPVHWRALATGARDHADAGDVRHFAAGLARLLEAGP